MSRKVKECEQLPKRVKITGVGVPNLYANLIKRTKKKAMYLRTDGIYEVFKIIIREAETIYKTKYPRREVYPKNEDFGNWASCFNYLKYAEREYAMF